MPMRKCVKFTWAITSVFNEMKGEGHKIKTIVTFRLSPFVLNLESFTINETILTSTTGSAAVHDAAIAAGDQVVADVDLGITAGNSTGS